MKLADLQYELPEELIAQVPAVQRDASRLLVLERASGNVRHEQFDRLPQLLPPEALLVLNNTRVLPARLQLRRSTGGRVEGLFIREVAAGVWEMMLSSSARLKRGETLTMQPTRSLRLMHSVAPGRWHAEPIPAGNALAILAECGEPPLPPYIKRAGDGLPDLLMTSHSDAERYQTVYAREPGAIAAPTAGLHFTPEMLGHLQQAGFSTAFVTLHVGVGTFSPIRAEDLCDHPMHAEWYECSAEAAHKINEARRSGRPIVAVGTTSARVLETCASESGEVSAGSAWTRIFIYPPYRFKAVDALLTNFHLPASTLLAMIFALAGRETILAAYATAIEQRYRFYSYGDAMLIL